MKILYINTLYSPLIKGGAEISLKLLVKGMKSKGFEVAVLSLHPEQGLSNDIVDGVKVYRAGLKNLYWPFSKNKEPKLKRLAWHYRDRYNSGMRAYVKEVLQIEKPDVVSCHNLAGWSVAVWDEINDLGIPIIQVLHDLYLLCANSNMYKRDSPCSEICLSCKLLRLDHRKKSLKVNAVVGISKSILARFEEEYYFENAEKNIIHNTRSIPLRGHIRHRQSGEPLKIGYLGTLSKIKGVEWLIEEFMKLSIDVKLSLAGKGHESYEKELFLMAADERIKFIGYTKPDEFFKTIDVLVVPSLWQEPLGMVAIEALANHIPVIANRSGGLQETVIDSVNGLFCESNKPESLGEAIEKLYWDAPFYNRLSASARNSVGEILNADRMISAYKTVVESVIEKFKKQTE